nr:MAG TPA: hypothetical protein [Caudoviricetes sp.]
MPLYHSFFNNQNHKMGTKITAMQEWIFKALQNNVGVLQYK